MQRNRGLDAFDVKHFEGATATDDGFVAIAAVDQELAHQTVVVRGDGVAGIDVGVHPNTQSTRDGEVGDAAR